MEQVENVQELWLQTKETDVVSEVIRLKDEIKAIPSDPGFIDTLLSKTHELNVLLDNLAEIMEYASMKHTTIKEVYDNNVDQRFIELKNSGEKLSESTIKAMSETENYHLLEEGRASKYIAKQLGRLYENCERIINFSQTRVKNITDSRVRSNFSGA